MFINFKNGFGIGTYSCALVWERYANILIIQARQTIWMWNFKTRLKYKWRDSTCLYQKHF